MEKVIIASMSNNRVIGKDGHIPWYNSTHMNTLHNLASKYPMIMGRKTYESIGWIVEDSKNIILTENKSFNQKNLSVCHSLDQALAKAEDYGKRVYIIGGGEIFRQTIDLVDILKITKMHRFFEGGDTRFPKINEQEWKEIEKIDRIDHSLHIYERIK